jgi:serine/threonine protein kinase
MQHTNIETVLDAGVTADGVPWFAMPYIDGSAITTHCDAEALSVRDRVLLFLQVCDGVSHAHEKGIIHRDLKPSNILIATPRSSPTVKIIDSVSPRRAILKRSLRANSQRTVRFLERLRTPVLNRRCSEARTPMREAMCFHWVHCCMSWCAGCRIFPWNKVKLDCVICRNSNLDACPSASGH